MAKESTDVSNDNENAALLPLRLLHGIVSRVDGTRCPMRPTCSHYGFEAIRKHGFIRGWIMTCDRLLRCGRDELHLSSEVIIDGKKYCHDPVAQNELSE
ncbi:MAG: membrane protein insertion efficiency factor YidD [Proteobacteria bacterium]|nr:membrane protein insertion efficiency factor YidD [Pseudomonadota bacterium]